MSGHQRRAALCWGQRSTWLLQHVLPADARREANRACRYPLPDGIGMAAVRATVSHLVRRHEALRTTYHFDADTDPWQLVHPPAAVPVRTVTTERDGTPSPAEVIRELTNTEFTLATEWPIRACVLTTAGRPRELVLVLNHLAFDAWTLDRLRQELLAFRDAITTRQTAALCPVRHQPVDLAHHQRSAAALAGKAAAVEFWRTEIAALPTDPLAVHRRALAAEQAEVRSATLTSPALLDAVRRIARRFQVWPSIVHRTAYHALLLAYTGADRVAYVSYHGNRTAAAYGDVLTCHSGPVFVNVGRAGNPSFGGLLTRVADQTRRAQEHPLPHDELLELLALEGFRRGATVRVASEFNYLTSDARPSRLRRSRFTPNVAPTAWAKSGADTHFRVNVLPDAVSVALNAVGTVMAAEALRRFLCCHEEIVLAHLDPAVDLTVDEIAELAGFPVPPAVDRAAAPVDRVDAAALEALLSVVGTANQLTTVDGSDCYVGAGGRLLRAPRVLAVLTQAGWTGLTLLQLTGALPLRTLAASLRRTEGSSGALDRPGDSFR